MAIGQRSFFAHQRRVILHTERGAQFLDYDGVLAVLFHEEGSSRSSEERETYDGVGSGSIRQRKGD